MTFHDPKLKGLAILIDDLSSAIDFLVNQATGASHEPSVEDYDTGHAREVARHLDDHLGSFAFNAIVNGTIIDRSTDFVFNMARRNPRLAIILPLKGFVKDLLNVGFSTQYQGKSFGEALTDRGLSKYLGLHLDGWMPEAKSFASSAAIHALKEQNEN